MRFIGRKSLDFTLAAAILSGFAGLGGCGGSGDSDTAGRTVADVDLLPVERSDFDMVIPVTGELAAQRQIEIRNKLESRALITEIVAEGQAVKKGDVLVRLADQDIKQKVSDAADKLKTAESSLVAAETLLAIKESTKASDRSKADVAVQMADLALKAWREGEIHKKRQELELAIEVAVINLDRSKTRFEQSTKLLESKYITKDEFDKDRIEMIQSEVKVKQSRADLELFESYTVAQEEAKRASDYDQAVAERTRTDQRNDAEIEKAKAEADSARYKVETARNDLGRAEQDLRNCTIVAPSDGLVVYATSIDSGGGGRGGGDVQPPQVGTELRPNELVIILPDTSRMIANLKVNEALSGRIRPGQVVTVQSDALPNVPLAGTVQSVSVLAASGGWRDPNRRDYTVKVALEADPSLGLKPSMRCKAEILLDQVKDSMSVPLQAIFRQGPIAYVYVAEGGGYAQRMVKLGRTSELRAEVLEGLKEGEQVLLREPTATEIAGKLDFDALQKAIPADADPRQAMRRGSGGKPSREGRTGESGGDEKPAGERTATADAKDPTKVPAAPNASEPPPSVPASK
jgi:multidrug efflux pump subunit AcrA (membrane-fusion protein)